jgi:hypothetical protein
MNKYFALCLVLLFCSIALAKTPEEINPLFVIKQKGKFGYIYKTGKIAIEPQFDNARSFSEGLAAVQKGKKWGFIDKNGKYVIEPTHSNVDNASNFSEGLAFIPNNGFIDQTGKVVIETQKYVMYADKFSEGLAWYNNREDKYGYINQQGDTAIEPQFTHANNFSEGLAAVRFGSKDSEKFGYIDTSGKFVIEPKYSWAEKFSEGFAAVQVSVVQDSSTFKKLVYKYGYIDKTGQIVIEPQFEDAIDFSDGLAGVKINEKWGYINKSGKIVIKPQYNITRSFSEGLAKVFDNDNIYFRYIDKNGKTVITFKKLPRLFDGDDFHNGLALIISMENEYGYINKAGKYIWKLTR